MLYIVYHIYYIISPFDFYDTMIVANSSCFVYSVCGCKATIWNYLFVVTVPLLIIN